MALVAGQYSTKVKNDLLSQYRSRANKVRFEFTNLADVIKDVTFIIPSSGSMSNDIEVLVDAIPSGTVLTRFVLTYFNGSTYNDLEIFEIVDYTFTEEGRIKILVGDLIYNV